LAKILKALATLAYKLRAIALALATAREAWQRNHDAAHRAHAKAKKAQAAADKLRKQGHPKKAAQKDARALSLTRKATAAHQRAQQVVGLIKELTQRQHGLAQTQAEKKAELEAYKKKHGVQITGNTATGGTARQRVVAVALASGAACAAGRRRNFYSQSGSWDVDHSISGERYGERSDCSSWVTSVFKSAGLPDPNGNSYRGGYTGTLGANGRRRSESDIKPACVVLYGAAPFHHVELYTGPGQRTEGHGSPPVDAGVIHLLPGPIEIRDYIS
jgi:hypothetical protein